MCFKPKGMKTRVLLCGKRLTQACRDRLRLSGTDPDSPPCISQLLHRDILFNIRKGLWGAGWGQPRQPLSPKPQPDSHLALLSGSWVSCAAWLAGPPRSTQQSQGQGHSQRWPLPTHWPRCDSGLPGSRPSWNPATPAFSTQDPGAENALVALNLTSRICSEKVKMPVSIACQELSQIPIKILSKSYLRLRHYGTDSAPQNIVFPS